MVCVDPHDITRMHLIGVFSSFSFFFFSFFHFFIFHFLREIVRDSAFFEFYIFPFFMLFCFSFFHFFHVAVVRSDAKTRKNSRTIPVVKMTISFDSVDKGEV